jgi:hypothetical protein
MGSRHAKCAKNDYNVTKVCGLKEIPTINSIRWMAYRTNAIPVCKRRNFQRRNQSRTLATSGTVSNEGEQLDGRYTIRLFK